MEIDDTTEYTQIGIRSFGRGIFHRDPCRAEGLSKLRYFHVNPERLVISNIMAWEGAIALSGEAEQGCIGSNRFLSYKAIGEIDLGYLDYYFQSAAGRDAIRSASTGTVTRNQTLSIHDFENLRVPAPNLTEQRHLATELGRAFDYSRKISDLLTKAGELRDSHLDSILSTIEHHVILSELLTPQADFVRVDPGSHYRVAGIYNRGRGLFERPLLPGSDTKYSRLNRLHHGQFVYSKLFGWEGSLAVVGPEFDGIHVSHEFPTFDIDTARVDPTYFSHVVRWRGLHKRLADQGTGMGSRRQRVNVDNLLATRVPLPPMPQQELLGRTLSTVVRSRDLGASREAKLRTLRSRLLDAAFGGSL
ncbi:MAG: restriction endonuclease subunit [Actinomycetota bacterium]|nr:restriction endonuclease subunit [Actinomycetota bacterium]